MRTSRDGSAFHMHATTTTKTALSLSYLKSLVDRWWLHTLTRSSSNRSEGFNWMNMRNVNEEAGKFRSSSRLAAVLSPTLTLKWWWAYFSCIHTNKSRIWGTLYSLDCLFVGCDDIHSFTVVRLRHNVHVSGGETDDASSTYMPLTSSLRWDDILSEIATQCKDGI